MHPNRLPASSIHYHFLAGNAVPTLFQLYVWFVTCSPMRLKISATALTKYQLQVTKRATTANPHNPNKNPQECGASQPE
jgi:hypothetical protein